MKHLRLIRGRLNQARRDAAIIALTHASDLYAWISENDASPDELVRHVATQTHRTIKRIRDVQTRPWAK